MENHADRKGGSYPAAQEYSLEGAWVEDSMYRFFPWLFRKIGANALITFILLVGALGSAVLGLLKLIRSDDTAFFISAVFFGTLLGWWMGRAKLSTWLSIFLGGAVASLANLFYFGKLALPLFTLLSRLRDLVLDAFRWPFENPPDTGPFLLAVQSFWAGLNAILTRVAVWVGSLSGGPPNQDPVPVILAWSTAVWACCLWAGWFVRRRNQVLQAILPAGILITAVFNYKRENPVNLALLLAFSLFLMIIVNQRSHQHDWETKRIDYSSEIQIDLALISIPLVIAILLAAIAIPSIPVKEIVSTIQHWSQPQAPAIRQVGRSLGLGDPGGVSEAGGLIGSPGLPRSHLLGGTAELSTRIVMTIHTGDVQPMPPIEFSSVRIPRYYWRSATYEQYTGRGWQNIGTQSTRYQAGTLAVPPWDSKAITTTVALVEQGEIPGYRLVQHEVSQAREGERVLYAAGFFLSADADTLVAWRKPSPESPSAPGAFSWIENGDIFGITVEAKSYRVKSLLPMVSIAELRQAGSSYPPEILRRYLALPESTPQRVLSLANEIVVGATTPYDKASAIETYLREIPYSLDIPAPPEGRDVVDFFLFDLRQGYCDYYATAMVVMARSVGLPSRLVIGYAGGSINPNEGFFTVSEADAHSWVEVFFPGYGWIEFEPTSGRPLIERLDRPPFAGPQETPQAGSQLEGRRSLVDTLLLAAGCLRSPAWVAGVLLFLLIVSVDIARTVDTWKLRRLPPRETLARLFRRMARGGRKLANPPLGATPYELSASVIRHLESPGQPLMVSGAFKPAVRDVARLTDLFTRASYSAHPLEEDDQMGAILVWRRLRWRLLAARVIKGIRDRGVV